MRRLFRGPLKARLLFFQKYFRWGSNPCLLNLWYYWYRGGLVEKVEELVEVVLEVVVRWWWCWW